MAALRTLIGGTVATLMLLGGVGHAAEPPRPRPKPAERPLDLALRLSEAPRERPLRARYKLALRPDPWEDLAGVGANDPGIPQRRDVGSLPVDVGGIGGLFDGETIPLFRWRVTPPL